MEELAERSGVTARSISNVERGASRSPHPRTISALADALDAGAADREQLDEAVRRARRRGAETDRTVYSRLLPVRVDDFVGRTVELGQLDAALTPNGGDDAARIVTVTGVGGMGKSTLAVEAVARAAARTSAEVCLLEMNGMGAHPETPAMSAYRALRDFGVAAEAIPVDEKQRFELYHRQLSESARILILDDAADLAQVTPLLPRNGPSSAVITSRHRLDGIGDVQIELQPMPREESRRLLAAVLETGPDDAGLDDLAVLCGNTPLALRIAANRLISRPAWSPRYLVDRLRDAGRRLDGLSSAGLSMESNLEVSYGQLSPRASKAFRRFALVPGVEASLAMLSVVSDEDLDLTERDVDELLEAGLINEVGDARYGMHDIVRVFARSRVRRDDSESQSRAAEQNLCSWLLRTAGAAAVRFDPDLPAPDDDDDDFASDEDALEWLDVELSNWHGAYGWASQHREWRLVVETAKSLHWYSDLKLQWDGWEPLFRAASVAAGAIADPWAEAEQLNNHAWALIFLSRDIEQGLTVARRAGEIAGSVQAYEQVGWSGCYQARALMIMDRLEDSDLQLELADEAFHRVGYVSGQLHARGIRGMLNLRRDRHDAAIDTALGSLEIFDQLDANQNLPMTFNAITACLTIADAEAKRGDPAASIRAALRAEDLSRVVDSYVMRSHAVVFRATALGRLGSHDDALRLLTEELAHVTAAADAAAIDNLTAALDAVNDGASPA